MRSNQVDLFLGRTVVLLSGSLLFSCVSSGLQAFPTFSDPSVGVVLVLGGGGGGRVLVGEREMALCCLLVCIAREC